MADLILEPEVIADLPFPGLAETGGSSASKSGSQETMTPETIPPREFPTQTIARDVISSSFDSQKKRILGEFTFNESGAIAIGKYESGVSGDIKISPTGIVGRNSAGATTFSIDATTGDATFKGTIAANSIIAGNTQIGSGGNVYIDGANDRIIVSDGSHDRVLIGKF